MNVQNPNQPQASDQPLTASETPQVTATPQMTSEGMPETQPTPPVAPPPEGLNDNTWAMLAHLGGLVGAVVPFGNVIAPLVIWQLKKDQSSFITDHAKEALNFQIAMMIAIAVVFVLTFVGIGFLLMPVVGIFELIFVVQAAVAANKGLTYRYPYTLHLVK